MYEELVERLRLLPSAAAFFGYTVPKDNPVVEIYLEAAEAIEKLSRRETPMKITEIHVDEYYCPACGAENNCDQGNVLDAYCPVCGQRLLLEPPKEET